MGTGKTTVTGKSFGQYSGIVAVRDVPKGPGAFRTADASRSCRAISVTTPLPMRHNADPKVPPQPVLTNVARVAVLARARQTDNAAYREWLKERSPLSNDQLDRLVEQIRTDIEPRIDCVACNHCCRTLQVVVDRKDIARLAKRFGVPADHFAEEHVDTAPDGVQHLRSQPCPSLGNDGACTVYEDRPKACRDYPYVDTPRFRTRSLTILENVPHCPIVFNVWERLKTDHPAPVSTAESAGTPGSGAKPARKPRHTPRP